MTSRRPAPVLAAGLAAALLVGCGGGEEPAPAGDRIVISPARPGQGHTHAPGQGHGDRTGDGHRARAGGYALTDVRLPAAGAPGDLSFRILSGGEPVTEYVEEQTRLLHLYLVREDLGVFRHLHPELDRAGTWRARVDLPTAGRYRLLGEFVPEGAGQVVLGTEVEVPGPDPTGTAAEPVGDPTAAANDDGVVRISIDEPLAVGPDGRMEVTVGDPEGREVALGSYLGAYAHVTGFETSTGDYVHVHPYGEPEPVDGGSMLAFHTEFAEPGSYRFFVQVRVDGFVHTVPVTARVA